jgi:threonine/homoserine/homoserine lactone efflux protein
MNVLNPKVSLFFLAFFPGFLFHDDLDVIVQFLILGISFALITLIVFGTIAFTAGQLKDYFENYQTQLLYVQVIVFVAIALLILIP